MSAVSPTAPSDSPSTQLDQEPCCSNRVLAIMKAVTVLTLMLMLLLVTVVITYFAVTKPKKHKQYQESNVRSTPSAYTDFSLLLYKSLSNKRNSENLVVSSLSLEFPLVIIFLGARGHTAEQIAAVMHLPRDKSEVETHYQQLFYHIKDSGSVDLEIINRMYLQNSFHVLDDFHSVARKSFGLDTREIDFRENSEGARTIINNWIQNKTKNKITEMIGPGVLNDMTSLVLVNVVYFKAQWLQPFNSQDTKVEKFHINRNEEAFIPMMHMKTFFSYRHAQHLSVQILELPYEGETVSMFILLPDDVEGISDLEAALPDINLASTFKDMQTKKVNVALPKFKVETSLDLKSNLMELGLQDMFQRESADLSGITSDPGLHVSHIIQKAFVEVTELGTEAGASSAVVFEVRSGGATPLQFVVDHPFFFMILEKRLNTALFMGRFLG